MQTLSWYLRLFLLLSVVLFQIIQANEETRPIFIVFVGLSGSGKSSTINTMLNRTITHIGSSESTTSEILEFSVKASGGKVDLRLIDTPGLQDTRGVETDARFLATLEDFLETHEYLSKQPPDVLIICQRFDDNRYADENAKFIKMLRTIATFENRLLKLSENWGNDHVNSKLDNAILVLTHFMGESLRIVKNPAAKLGNFRRAMNQYTTLPGESIPIIFAENQGAAQELEAVDGGYMLANGDIYPQNLCNKTVKLILAGNPSLKSVDIKICIGQAERVEVDLISNVSLVHHSHPKAIKHLNILIHANTKAVDTEVSLKLKQAYDQLLSTNGDSSSLASILGYLQVSLHNWRIFNVTDIPRRDTEIEEIFRKLKKDDGVKMLLETAFRLKPPIFSTQDLPIGHGYSFALDRVLPTTPFKIIPGEYVSCLGSVLPKGTECKINTQLKQMTVYKDVPSTAEYFQDRATTLDFSKNVFAGAGRIVNHKPGYTTRSLPHRSFYVEFQAFKINSHSFELSENYLSQLDLLPRFNASSRSSISAFQKLFSIYGSHVVSSINYGGSLEFLLSKDLESSSITSLESIVVLLKRYEHLIKLKIHGGDLILHSSNPSLFFSESSGISLFARWKNSLLVNSVPLTVKPELVPISNSLRANGRNQKQIQEVEKALTYFQSSEYAVDGPETILQNSINTCQERKQSELTDINDCENDFKNREKVCEIHAAECKSIETQIRTTTDEKQAIELEIFKINTTLATNIIENYSLTLKNATVESNLQITTALLNSAREQVQNEKQNSARLKALLAG